MIADDNCRVAEQDRAIEEMRETRRRGLAVATKAAADLRDVADQLNSLRALPRPPLEDADPSEFYELRLPAFLFDVETAQPTIGALVEHLLVLAVRYEETARDLAAALDHLEMPGETPACKLHVPAAKGERLTDEQFSEIAAAICYGYGADDGCGKLSDRAEEFLGPDGGVQALLAELRAERQRNATAEGH